MPDNQNSIMVVVDRNGKGLPNVNWTDVGDDLAARRTTYANCRKLIAVGYKQATAMLYRRDPNGGPTAAPNAVRLDGNTCYSYKYDDNGLLFGRCDDSGSNTAARTFVPDDVMAPAAQEAWDSSQMAGVALEGLRFEDAGVSGSQKTAAEAVDTDDVPLG